MNDSILSYLREQGGVPFSEKPLGEVDALVLCQFSYLKFDGLVPGVDQMGNVVSLKELTLHPMWDDCFRTKDMRKQIVSYFKTWRRAGALED
ncbi:MAG: hypothetical protein K6F51_11880 [Acetatifactor sp.]|nr:hypothetical protein [Acetatifactor sp.]